MIISEKQIMQLISIANGSIQLLLKSSMNEDAHEDAIVIANLIDIITNQQYEELKVIE